MALRQTTRLQIEDGTDPEIITHIAVAIHATNERDVVTEIVRRQNESHLILENP